MEHLSYSMMRRVFVIILLLVPSLRLSAQHRDTLYLYETEVIHDTLIVRDTTYIHDTLRLNHSASEKNVADMDNASENTLPKSKETIVSEPQTPAEEEELSRKDKKVKKTDFLPEAVFFDGFHLGYVLEADLLSKAKLSNTNYMRAKNSIGGHIGLEFAYHFAKYLGVSAGLSYGTTGAFHFLCRNDWDESWIANENRVPFHGTHYGIYSTGLSMPVKFEFHAPISQKAWVTVDAGVRLRMPWYTFVAGYDNDVSSPYSMQGLIWPDTTEYYSHLRLAPEVLDANRFNADFLADAGFYFRLGYGGLLRWTIGIDLPFKDFAQGNYTVRLDGYNGDHSVMPVSYDNGTFRLRSNMFNTQITFIHTFQKPKRCAKNCAHWTEEGLYRHEFKFDVCDPTGVMLFDRYFVFVYPNGMEPNRTWRNKSFTSTPVFSLSSHYRVAKWFWVGLSFSVAAYQDPETVQNGTEIMASCNRDFYTMAFMPEIRFSYLNRPHVTLYSALSVGIAQFFGTEECFDVTYPENRHPWFSDGINGDYTPTQFSMLHVTLLGVKAGWHHVFGSLELGAGYKGFGSVGIGYEF
ncbi:MAG: hypothetical protein IKU03_07195 [Bacteroidales bacterium]|nr:hypothetical protein [Bacteroidales bacterium]